MPNLVSGRYLAGFEAYKHSELQFEHAPKKSPRISCASSKFQDPSLRLQIQIACPPIIPDHPAPKKIARNAKMHGASRPLQVAVVQFVLIIPSPAVAIPNPSSDDFQHHLGNSPALLRRSGRFLVQRYLATRRPRPLRAGAPVQTHPPPPEPPSPQQSPLLSSGSLPSNSSESEIRIVAIINILLFPRHQSVR